MELTRPRLRWGLAALLSALLLILPASALDDDEFDGYAADTLTIKVGYFGGPYYEKAVFTLDQLWAMDVVYADYTFIDNMPSVVIDHVAGVRLADLMDAAGIDLNSIQTFYFWTRDKQSDYYTSYSKTALIDAPRYCYYSLPDNYDDEGDGPNEFATSYGVPVDTVLALADDWNRCIAGASFGSDYLNLNTNTRFRLVFGQTNGYEQTASRSAKWIHEIVVELGGAPVLTLDAFDLEGEVGSILRAEAGVSADSAVLANETVTWSSSDESIAAVDANGTITVRGEGTAIITAEFAGVTASVTVNGTPGDGEPDPAPPPSGPDGPDTPSSTSNSGVSEGQQEQAAPPAPVEAAPSQTEPEPAGLRLTLVTAASSSMGGLQNWREAEMSDTAAALPDLAVPPSALAVCAAGVGALFAGSGAVYAALFYRNVNVGRKRNEFQSK